MHSPFNRAVPLSYEEKHYLEEQKRAKRVSSNVNVDAYQKQLLRDRGATASITDDLPRRNVHSVYAKLNQVEYMSRGKLLPFREDMFIGNK